MVDIKKRDLYRQVVMNTGNLIGRIVEYRHRNNGKNFHVQFSNGRDYWIDRKGKLKSGINFYAISLI